MENTPPPRESIIKLPKNGLRIGIIVLALNFLALFFNLYLSNGYVSKAVYEADVRERIIKNDRTNEELKNIALELRGITDHMENIGTQNKRLDDLEQRMREQERKR